METVYHTTFDDTKRKILKNGLKSKKTTTPLGESEITTKDGYFILPSSETNPFGYAQSLVVTILEQERPTTYPKHHNCLFFFTSKNQIGSLDRPIALEIDTDAFNNEYPLYQTDWDVATELFYDTMREFEIMNEIKASKLRMLARDYWKQTENVSSKSDIIGGKELFVNTDRIESKYISLFKTRR